MLASWIRWTLRGVGAIGCGLGAGVAGAVAGSFVNFETAPVHPTALSSGGSWLAVCNLPDNRLEVFDVGWGSPVWVGDVVVGLDPVSVAFRTETEVWVVNHISDSISVVDLEELRVIATLGTSDGPADVVFGGESMQAFVSCADSHVVQVFDPVARELLHTIAIAGRRPRSMAVAPDKRTVYVAIFESGNATTILAPALGTLDAMPQESVVSFPNGPYGGINPPPNAGTAFLPAINPEIPAEVVLPRVGLIVRRDGGGRWMDDNGGDWAEFVSGTNSVFSGRPRGWDLLDHDVASIDAVTREVTYLTGLMNICMDVAVNPASGHVTVVGTDALNQVRFEPVLRGTFLRVNLALAMPGEEAVTIKDLNSHLDYTVGWLPEADRSRSIGDPRGVVWSGDGTRGYVTGMGSDNLVIVNAEGDRVGREPALKMGEGPTGMALDEARGRLYVWNRFSSTISVVDTESETVVETVPVFDPTPASIRAGRKHLYNTHATSGLGHVSCASCHVDARFDRLAWDLGDPHAEVRNISPTNANFARFRPGQTNDFHPMKGPMVTQTLQDIIGHEPFHWRGDRSGIEEFNVTFTNLQGRAELLTTNEMIELKEFLATIHFPPNPHREFDNSLATNLALTGHVALGRGQLAAGQPLPVGNAEAGLTRFRSRSAEGCIHCHTLPTGVGPDLRWTGFAWEEIAAGANGERHASLIQLNRSRQLPFKIVQLRNLGDKMGMDTRQTRSQAGFGFLHDGSVDSLVRFVQDGFDLRDDQETSDLVAFLLSFTGSDLPPAPLNDPERPPGLAGKDVHAAVGRQITTAGTPLGLVDDMIALATAPTDRLELIVRGSESGLRRGWLFDPVRQQFLSDRNGEELSPQALRGLAGEGRELTYTLVPRDSGRRIGIDRDEDGYFDVTEVEFGSDPADPLQHPLPPRIGNVTFVDDGVILSWSAVPGRTYRVQFKQSLDDPTWLELPGEVVATATTATKSDVGENDAAERYYRILLID